MGFEEDHGHWSKHHPNFDSETLITTSNSNWNVGQNVSGYTTVIGCSRKNQILKLRPLKTMLTMESNAYQDFDILVLFSE